MAILITRLHFGSACIACRLRPVRIHYQSGTQPLPTGVATQENLGTPVVAVGTLENFKNDGDSRSHRMLR